MKKKFIALGHCNVSLGIYLDTMYSVYGRDVALQIVSNYKPEENPFDGRTFLHDAIDTLTVPHKDWVSSINDEYLLTGMAPATKKKIFDFFNQICSVDEAQYVSLVHKQAIIAHGVVLDGPVYISSGSVVAQYARLGKFVSIQRNVIVEHHTQIGEFSSIFSGANIAASCIIGKNVSIASGAVILNGLEIGDNVLVGAGAVVTKSIPANTVVYGNPARVINKI